MKPGRPACVARVCALLLILLAAVVAPFAADAARTKTHRIGMLERTSGRASPASGGSTAT